MFRKFFFFCAIILLVPQIVFLQQPLVSLSELYDLQPNVNDCTEGKLKETEKSNILTIYNQIRVLHGLKTLQYNSAYDEEVAKASLISVANAMLDHFPKSNYACYTQKGYDGCRTSNLYISSNFNQTNVVESKKSMITWIIDKNVPDLGHRRNMLNPFLKYASFGRVDGFPKAGSQSFLSAMSLKVHEFPDYHNLSDWSGEYVAYPFQEYPSEFFDPTWYLSFTVIADKSSPWANGSNAIDFSKANVTIKDQNNNTIQVTDIKFDYLGYGVPNCLYWKASNITKNVTYYITITNVTVKGQNKTYNYWFKIVDEVTTILNPPTLLSPSNNATDLEPPITLSWSSVANADSYKLQVSEFSNFSSLIIEQTVNGTQYTLSNLKSNTQYYWRIASISGSQQSQWSATFTFKTKDQPLIAPLLVYPRNNETSVTIRPKFIWNSVPNATAYHFQLALSDSFDDFSLIVDNPSVKDTFFTSTANLIQKTLHYWRVRTIVDKVSSPWSEVFTFWTVNLASVDDSFKPISIIYSSETIEFRFETCFLKYVTVYNILGIEVDKFVVNNFVNIFELNTSKFTSGAYILEFTFNNQRFVFPIFVAR